MVARDADVDQVHSIESGVLDQSRTVKVLTFVRFTSSRAEEFHTEINTKVFKLFQRWWSLWKEQEVSAQCVCVFEDTTVCVCFWGYNSVCVCVCMCPNWRADVMPRALCRSLWTCTDFLTPVCSVSHWECHHLEDRPPTTTKTILRHQPEKSIVSEI